MKIRNLHDLFVHELRDIYHAEKQITKALPKLAKAACSDELRAAFEEHFEQTRRQIERLEEVFDELDLKPKGKTCEAMEGLISEGADLTDKTDDDTTCDAGLIASAQKVEHYEIASYGCLISWAQQLDLHRVVELLRQTLAEEKTTDQKLTALAERKSNVQAERTGGETDQARPEPAREPEPVGAGMNSPNP
jgi:ferritin-like metal-binding protein YciE